MEDDFGSLSEIKRPFSPLFKISEHPPVSVDTTGLFKVKESIIAVGSESGLIGVCKIKSDSIKILLISFLNPLIKTFFPIYFF